MPTNKFAFAIILLNSGLIVTVKFCSRFDFSCVDPEHSARRGPENAIFSEQRISQRGVRLPLRSNWTP